MVKKFMRLTMLLAIFILASCQGYRVVGKKNPFSQYNIRKIAIPAFLNQSTLPNMSSSFTKEISLLLREYDNLEIVPPDYAGNKNYVIGIIKSRETLARTIETTSQRVANSATPNNLGNRENFSIPATSRINVKLQIVVIKNPTKEEVEILRTSLGQSVKGNGKVVFNHTFDLTENYTHEIFDGETNQVTSTQTYGSRSRAIQNLAKRAASQFKDIILYAF